MDIKSNISAFSDDLLKNDALSTVIKEVRDFIEQLEDEKISKDGILYHHKANGYDEQQTFGIITKNFESEKFLQAAEFIEELLNQSIDKQPLGMLKVYKLNPINTNTTEAQINIKL